ncbi:hypothetical protein ACHAWF_000951, partial [Thalassiosira exigua]
RLPFPESSLRHDTYNGVTLDLTALPIKADRFVDMLGRALDIRTAEEMRGIWIRILTSQAHLIAPAARIGFDFQHAEPWYCVLAKWIPKETESRLPNGPTHQVGIGVLVIHPLTGKMLAVEECTGPAAKRKLWKMPTGLTDPGEDIALAAFGGCRRRPVWNVFRPFCMLRSVARGSVLVGSTCSSCASAASRRSTTPLLS